MEAGCGEEGVSGKNVENVSRHRRMYDSYKIMSKAVGVQKPQEAQKARVLWTIKQPRTERKSFMIGLAKTTFWKNKTRLELWEGHLNDPTVALDKAPKRVEGQY